MTVLHQSCLREQSLTVHQAVQSTIIHRPSKKAQYYHLSAPTDLLQNDLQVCSYRLFYILFLYIIGILGEELLVCSIYTKADMTCLYHRNSCLLSCRIYMVQLKNNATLEMQ